MGKYQFIGRFSRHLAGRVANLKIKPILVHCPLFSLTTQYTHFQHLLNTRIVSHINDKQSNTRLDNFHETANFQEIARSVKTPGVNTYYTTESLSYALSNLADDGTSTTTL